MSDHAALQRAYAARRQAHAAGAQVVTRPVRHIGQDAMEHPPAITYRVDMEAEVRERLRAAGLRFADEVVGQGDCG